MLLGVTSMKTEESSRLNVSCYPEIALTFVSTLKSIPKSKNLKADVNSKALY